MTRSPTPLVFTLDGYHPTEDQYLTASGLKGLDVHGRDDARIGAIRSLVVGPDDAITGAIVDIGGSLGIGMHSVLVPFGDQAVRRESIDTALRVGMDATEDQIKAMARYDE